MQWPELLRFVRQLWEGEGTPSQQLPVAEGAVVIDELLAAGDAAGGDHLQGARLHIVRQPHVCLPRDMIQRVPQGHQALHSTLPEHQRRSLPPQLYNAHFIRTVVAEQ